MCLDSPVSTESVEAPLRKGATTRHSTATLRRRNAAGVDAAALEPSDLPRDSEQQAAPRDNGTKCR